MSSHAGGAPEPPTSGGHAGAGVAGAGQAGAQGQPHRTGDQSLFENGGQGEARAAEGGTIAPEGAGAGTVGAGAGMHSSGSTSGGSTQGGSAQSSPMQSGAGTRSSTGTTSQGAMHGSAGSSVPVSHVGHSQDAPSYRYSQPPSTPDTWGPDFGWLDTPYRAMRGFFDQVGRLADEFSSGRPWMAPNDFTRSIGRGIGSVMNATGMWSPAVEVFERDGNIVISADLPGMTKKDVTVEVTDDSVIIQGERRSSSQSSSGGGFRSERYYGHFSRRIPLPDGADTSRAQATFNDGVLELVIPRSSSSDNRRRIDIS